MATTTTAVPRMEMLQVAEAVSKEKNITKAEVLEALEQAIAKAAKAKYGPDYDIRATIDTKTGTISIARYREVVEEVEEEDIHIDPTTAEVFQPGIQIGEFLIEELPPIDLGRISAQSAKQVIVQKVRESERKRMYEEFKDKSGEIINGVVKRIEYGNVTVDLNSGRGEGFLRRDELIMREVLNVGDRVRAYVFDVRDEPKGPIIFLSRTHPMFMAKLFAQEVPEIYEGIIEIKSVARDPGSRAKMAVHCEDPAVDPVGACVGMRGSRVQAVVGELQGEKVDIVPWAEDPATFVVNALAPAEVSKIVLDEDAGRLEVVVAPDQLSLAIGRRGQNVRLASNLTGWEIDILTEEQENERRQKEYQDRSQLFMTALDVDDMIASLLVNEGFSTVEQVAFVDVADLMTIEGFEEEIASELQARAAGYLQQLEENKLADIEAAGLKQDIYEVEGLTSQMILTIFAAGVKSRDDLADLAGDELVDMMGEGELTEDEANEIIMAARAHWFEDDAGGEDPTPAASE